MRRASILGVLALALTLLSAAPALAAGPTIVDLTSPTHPDQNSGFFSNDPAFSWNVSPEIVGSCWSPTYAYDAAVAIDGHYAYLADYEQGLQVYDISDPTDPVRIGGCDTPSQSWDVAVSSDYAYVADFTAGLQIIALQDPEAPTIVAAYDTPGECYGVRLIGDRAYVSFGSGGLVVLDVTDPLSPQLVGSCDTPGEAHDVAVNGQLAYVADGFGGLQIIALDGLAAWSVVGACYMPGFAWGVAFSGTCAYVAAEEAGLQVVDVSDPGQPVLRGYCDTPGRSFIVEIAGDVAVVADAEPGVQFIDISDPASPTILATCRLPAGANGLALHGDYVYAADFFYGLQIVKLSTRFGYSYELDQDPYGVPGETVRGTARKAAFTDVANGTWYFHVRAVALDAEDIPVGAWGPTTTYRVIVEHGPRIEDLLSPTHPNEWEWYDDNDPLFTWAGLEPLGYSYTLDGTYDTKPDETVDGAEPTASYADVPDGVWWFHVRAVDADGNWGPAAHRRVMINVGPITMALPFKTAKRGSIWLRYSVADDQFSWADVTIDITTAAGKLVHSMYLGPRETNQTWSTVVDTKLAKGRYTFVVHAVDPLGVHESQTGSAYFVVR